MSEKPRLLVLDLLESFARERDVDVRLERHHTQQQWICELRTNDAQAHISTRGGTARVAIMTALRQAGVDVPR
jgi:hypothetical protein